MNNIDLCKIKFRLECIEVLGNPPFRLARCDGSTCDDIERLCIAQTTFGDYLTFLGDPSLTWAANDPSHLFADDDLARRSIHTIELRRELWYSFVSPLFVNTSQVTELGDTPHTLDTFAILDGDAWISRAWSVRRNETSAEIAVETKESHRRRGYGRIVVAAWANSQISKGKTGIYAHRKYNLESKYLAEKAGAVLFADVLSLQ